MALLLTLLSLPLGPKACTQSFKGRNQGVMGWKVGQVAMEMGLGFELPLNNPKYIKNETLNPKTLNIIPSH